MRRPLLVLLLVLATLIAPAAPVAHGHAAVLAETGDADPGLARAGAPEVALIDQAARLLQEKFFEPVDTAEMYAAAIDAANDELKTQKVDARLAKAKFGTDASQNWGLFYDAYMGVAQANAEQIDQKALAYAVITGM